MLKRIKRSENIITKLRNREGASLVLVAIISIIIVTGVVILRITTGTLLASADKQLNQDQAYMMAVSLGDSIDKLVSEGKISDLSNLSINDSANTQSAIKNSSVSAVATEHHNGVDKYVIVTVSARVADAEYEYKLTYLQSGSTYTRLY